VMQQQRLQGVTVGSVEDLQALVDAITVNRMKPVIDKTFPSISQEPLPTWRRSALWKVAIAIG